MLKKHDELKEYAKVIDGSPVPDSWLGYYRGASDGSGHMVMWKPAVDKGTDAAERTWARVLTHEFTHAFVARYRSNRRVPRWLNEGLAEVVAMGQFPRPVYDYVNSLSSNGFDFKALFDDRAIPGGEMYPVMQTMVEYMMHRDRPEFFRYLNDIKDGMDADDALMKHFLMDHDRFEKMWRLHAARLHD